MKKKALALAIAGALCVPQTALAATDDSGMQYTSASEGFYGSLRAVFRSSHSRNTTSGPGISADNGVPRLGVRGSLDLGGGLSGIYRSEWGLNFDNDNNAGDSPGREPFRARLNYVGLKGNFGSVSFGRQWSEDYNFVTASTDLTNNSTGWFTSAIRRGNLAKYVSPDINGFQGALQFTMDGAAEGVAAQSGGCFSTAGVRRDVAQTDTSDTASAAQLAILNGGNVDQATVLAGLGVVDAGAGMVTCGATASYRLPVAAQESEDIDRWTLAAKYSIRGFTVAGTYDVQPDGLTTPTGKDDAVFWGARLGYGQDNWSVNAWYGEHNDSDRGGENQDREILSVAGKVNVGKVDIYAIVDNEEDRAKQDHTRTVVGVTYHLGSRSRVWVDYLSVDDDGSTTEEDSVAIGLRHDF